MNAFFETRIEALRNWLREQQKQRRAARTQLFLASLPDDIRKDIGWPDGRTAPAPFPTKEPKWDAAAFLAGTECRLGKGS